jgi:hypothetical protein
VFPTEEWTIGRSKKLQPIVSAICVDRFRNGYVRLVRKEHPDND